MKRCSLYSKPEYYKHFYNYLFNCFFSPVIIVYILAKLCDAQLLIHNYNTLFIKIICWLIFRENAIMTYFKMYVHSERSFIYLEMCKRGLSVGNLYSVIITQYQHNNTMINFCLMISNFVQCLCRPGDDFESSLLSFEKLDRASPDLWPEQRKHILFWCCAVNIKSFKVFLSCYLVLSHSAWSCWICCLL